MGKRGRRRRPRKGEDTGPSPLTVCPDEAPGRALPHRTWGQRGSSWSQGLCPPPSSLQEGGSVQGTPWVLRAAQASPWGLAELVPPLPAAPSRGRARFALSRDFYPFGGGGMRGRLPFLSTCERRCRVLHYKWKQREAARTRGHMPAALRGAGNTHAGPPWALCPPHPVLGVWPPHVCEG